MLHAPSSSEYSEWTCRCATDGVLIGVETIGVAADATRASGRVAPAIVRRSECRGCRLRRAGRAARGQRVRDLHRPRRIGARRRRRGRPPRRRTRPGRRWTSCSTRRARGSRRCAGARPRGSCRARRRGSRWRSARASRAATAPSCEALPRVDAVVLMQRGHEYKYARCAALAGARVEWIDDIAAALASGGGPPRSCTPRTSTTAARRAGRRSRRWRGRGRAGRRRRRVPELPAVRAGALGDAAATSPCFSAKYFWGPNGGGFVAGRGGVWSRTSPRSTSPATRSGRWRTFGRAFKLDRATVAATVAALEEWVGLDHDARLAGYAELARALAARCARAAGRARGAASSSRSTSGWSTGR